MAHMSSHYKRESAHLRRPENVGVGRSLCSSLHDTLMDRAKFVHVVGLIRSRSGIHEREHTCDKQSRFVMRHCIWSRKDGTGFSVLTLTIAEEERIGSGIIMAELACLADETTREGHSVLNARTA